MSLPVEWTLIDPHLLKTSLVVTGACAAAVLALSSIEKSYAEDGGGVVVDVIEQCRRWFAMSEQDTDAFLKYQHAVLSLAYLNVARHVASDEAIERVSHVHVRALAKRIETSVLVQEKALASRVAANASHGSSPSSSVAARRAAIGSRRITWM